MGLGKSVASLQGPDILWINFGFDPATSSAPFVATLVDVTGLIIYFSVGMSCPGLNFDASVSVVTVITSI